jgi:hypothetical protein
VLSPQYLFWECKNDDGQPDNDGTYVAIAFKELKQNVTCLDDTWTYNPDPGTSEGQGPPPVQASREALAHRIPTFMALAPTGLVELQHQVASGRCIAFSVPVYNSWYMSLEVQQSGAITMPIPGEIATNQGHAMCIVGYVTDENAAQPDNPGGGFFIVRNSWGSGWGASSKYGAGYGSIPYAYIASYCLEAYTIG